MCMSKFFRPDNAETHSFWDMGQDTFKKYYNDFRTEYERVTDLLVTPVPNPFHTSTYLLMRYYKLVEDHRKVLHSWLGLLYAVCEMPEEKVKEYIELYHSNKLDLTGEYVHYAIDESRKVNMAILYDWHAEESWRKMI